MGMGRAGGERSSAQEGAVVRRGRKEREKEGKEKEKGKKKKKNKGREKERERVAAGFTAATTGPDENARRSVTRSTFRGTRERKRWEFVPVSGRRIFRNSFEESGSRTKGFSKVLSSTMEGNFENYF